MAQISLPYPMIDSSVRDAHTDWEETRQVARATQRQKRIVNDALTRTLNGEGPYWAELAGQSWPGVTP